MIYNIAEELAAIFCDMAWSTIDLILFNQIELEKQISDIESERHISFRVFDEMLIKRDMGDYSQMLFIILAGLNPETYLPLSHYPFKKPDKEQQKLIEAMLYLYLIISVKPAQAFRR